MSTNRTRTKSTTAITKALHYRGLLTRVANEMGLTRQHVGRVARGERQSRRVFKALLAEIDRIEKAA